MLIWLVVCSLLHRTPVVQPQPTGLSWAAQGRRPHIHRPSRSSVVETPRRYVDHRRRPVIPVTPRAQPRFCACNPTSHWHVSSATRSVTSHALDAFHKVPASGLYRAHVIRPPCCVGFLASCSSPQDISDMMYSRPVPKSKWCVYAVTVHVCAVKRVHSRNLGLKINNK